MLSHLSDSELLKLESLYQQYPLQQNLSRLKDVVECGYSLKFAYHCVRLMNEVEQILVEGDLDLLRNREQLKSIRRGEWTLEELEAYFTNKEHALETAYSQSRLPHGPDEEKIKNLLLECLSMHYGSLDGAIKQEVPVSRLISEIESIISRYRNFP
jgi:hypothetical protein